MNDKTILIIEDNKEIAETCKNILINHGYAIKTVTTSEEGIRFLEHSTPKMILLDCGNTETHSCNTLERIQHITESKSRIMILPDSEDNMEAFIKKVEDTFSKCDHTYDDEEKVQYIQPGTNTFKMKNPYTDDEKDIEITITIK